MNIHSNYQQNYNDIYTLKGLRALDDSFLNYLFTQDKLLHKQVCDARINNNLSNKEQSQLIIEVSLYLEKYLVDYFGIQNEADSLKQTHHPLLEIAKIKRNFVQRQALRKYSSADNINGQDLILQMEKLIHQEFNEQDYANYVQNWILSNDEEKLDIAAKYAAWAIFSDEGQKKHQHGTLFKIPKKIDNSNLINLPESNEGYKLKYENLSSRNGFKLSDPGCKLQYAIDQSHYCISCHNQQKDSCSKGLKDNQDNFKKSDLGISLLGCPLEEKISEMIEVKKMGFSIAALAIICIDNPMVAATGHRICNDCMKSCIYQKQEPVNIPEIESRVLKDVLSLSWGFEIYALLTHWNPLNISSPLPLENSGRNVLVVGMGPSGFTLAHYLLRLGHNVTGIDGLKIEPLSEKYLRPIENINNIFTDLDERKIQGFGGVMEYGITVRWNKNYLQLIRIILERHKNFTLFGAVRFGSNITPKQAFEMGFDHIALCMGAGKPNLLNIPNAMAKGVRTASDFLMSLQLTGAAQKHSISNLQIRLPIIVIGGGLTAIDAATEALTYYKTQVEKFSYRANLIGIENLSLTEEEKIIAREFLEHAELFREYNEYNSTKIIEFIDKLGGVKIFYRNNLQDAPSYKLNHEELSHALKEGISFIPNKIPHQILTDEYQAVSHMSFIDKITNEIITVPARTVIIATGTSPNVTIAKEYPDNFILNGKYLAAVNEKFEDIDPERSAKPSEINIIAKTPSFQNKISYFGDLHPSFAGNVVKAMASAKIGCFEIHKLLSSDSSLINKIDNNILHQFLDSTVHEVILLTDNIVEIIVKSKLAAQNFKPGQFYRLQNIQTQDSYLNQLNLELEGIALTGAWSDRDSDLISLIVLEMGGSSSLCRYLQKGEKIALMGPTGAATDLLNSNNVLLMGGGLGNAVLFSIGKALKASGSKVTYFAGYKKEKDRFHIKDIEEASDQIIWCCDELELTTTRPQDLTMNLNVVDALIKFNNMYPNQLKTFDKLIVIGSDRMMHAVQIAVRNKLRDSFNENLVSIASVNSPMQCMMKEICAQCIQKHIDPISNEEYYIYSCTDQDQPLNKIDFNFLHHRLTQNSLLEKLTSHWISHNIKKS